MRVILPCLLLSFMALPTLASPTREDLRQIEQQLRQEQQVIEVNGRRAEELSGELEKVQGRLVQLARTIQQKEDDLTRLDKRQEQLMVRQDELQSRLRLTDRQTAQVVAGLQTLALRPPELALMQADTPIQTIRSRMLMGYSLPVVRGANKQTRADLAELSRVKNELQAQIVRIKSTQSQLADQSEQMNRLLRQKSIMQAQYQISRAQSEERVNQLAGQARDLKDLLARLEMEKQKAARNAAVYRDLNRPAPVKNDLSAGLFARSKGQLPYPIRGKITGHFGVGTLAGGHTRGMTITGRSQAQVVAPFDGTVLFAGPFKNYGELVILDHGNNYLTLLAGMDKTDLLVGQNVLAGEPIGRMKSVKPELYVEIRHDGQVLDPEPWFIRQS